MKLLQWQDEALTKLKNREKGSGLCLQVSTGLGKGVIGAFIADKVGNCLIIAPPHLEDDWKSKLSSEVNVLSKTNLVMTTGVNFISFMKFLKYHKEIKFKSNFFLIIDEAHRVKNYKSKSFKAILSILPLTNAQFLLSATFESKSSVDLFAPAFLTNPSMRKQYKDFYSFSRANVLFKQIYVHKRVIQQPVSIYPQAIEKYIKSQFFVATYESTGIKRPDFVIKEIPLSSNKKLDKIVINIEKEDIDTLAGKAIHELSSVEYQSLINLIANPHSKFAQISNQIYYNIDKESYDSFNYNNKINKVNSIINSEKEVGNKGLLFYFYQAELELIKKKVKGRIFYFDSKLPVEKQINDFEKGDCDICVANYKALGEGVRFKKTNYIIEYTLIYDYSAILQARGRLQYVGREDIYTIYHLQLQHKVITNLVDNIKTKQESIKNNMKLLGY